MPCQWFLIFCFCNVAQYEAAVIVMLIGNHSNTSGPFTSKKHVNKKHVPALMDMQAFFGCGDEEYCHSMLMLLVARSKWWHRVSSAVMILERNWFPISWYHIRCCMEIDMRWIFCSFVNCFGTHYAQTLQYRRFQKHSHFMFLKIAQSHIDTI